MPRRVKKKSHEKLTDTNVQHVVDLLKGEDPITKKEACSILNISYNTTRLTNIIDNVFNIAAIRFMSSFYLKSDFCVCVEM